MRAGLLSSALAAMAIAIALGGLVSMTTRAFAQSQQPRDQSQPQQGGLSPDKKRVLSGFDPTEILGTPERGDNGANNRATSRQPQQTRGRTQNTPDPPQSARPKPPVTTAATPPATSATAPSQSPTETSSPMAPTVSLDSAAPQPPPGADDASAKAPTKWTTPVLLAAALIISAALILTLTKLLEKIRETSAG